MESGIWRQTYRSDDLPGVPGVRVMSALQDCTGGQRKLVAHLAIHHRVASVAGDTRAELTPTQMRDLADLLIVHANRVECQLLPQLHPPVDLIDFTLNPAPVAG